jgi:DNA invertase Pin-like site-specific DNA recombinase
MNALKPKPTFQVLIMSEESRLGREQIETAYALKQIMDAGVRVFFYLEARERTLDNALDKVMLSLTNFAAEMEREKARQRAHDALLRKAKALYVPGGVVYGYTNFEVLSTEHGPDGRPKRLHVIRHINAEQAAVVRRIFELYASGLGITRIAKRLNAEHVAPTPRSFPSRLGAHCDSRDSPSRAVPGRRDLEPHAEGRPRRHATPATPPRGGMASPARARPPNRL